MPVAAAGRRDTPAARAALARRRQRAAQTLRPSSSSSAAVAPTTDDNHETKQPPVAATSSGISRKPRPPPISTNAAVSSKPMLSVDTTSPAAMATSPPESSGNNVPYNANRMTQLTRRALGKNKSPTDSVMDATHTTVALTTSTTSPEKQKYTTTPQQALQNSRQAAEQATFMLQAMNTSRGRYHSHTRSTPMSTTTNAAALTNIPPTIVEANSASTPSTAARQHEDLLTASRRRRQALEASSSSSSQQRWMGVAATSGMTDHHKDGMALGTRPAAKTMTNPRYLSSSPRNRRPATATNHSPSRAPSRDAGAEAVNTKRPSNTSPMKHRAPAPIGTSATATVASDSPLAARTAKLEISEQQRRQQSPSVAVVPVHNNTNSNISNRKSPSRSGMIPRRDMSPLAARQRSSPRPRQLSSPQRHASPAGREEASFGNFPPPSPRNLTAGKSPGRPTYSTGIQEQAPPSPRPSPRQFFRDPPPTPPPPPPQQNKYPQQKLKQQQNQQASPHRQHQVQSRSPSPNQRKTSSQYMERNSPRVMQRPRPTAVQAQTLESSPRRPGSQSPTPIVSPSLQQRAMQQHRRREEQQRTPPRGTSTFGFGDGRNADAYRQSPQNFAHGSEREGRPNSGGVGGRGGRQSVSPSPRHSTPKRGAATADYGGDSSTLDPYRSPQHYSYGADSNNTSNHSGRSSPGVERLSAFLLDTTDVSTIADMTLHALDTPRASANFSFAVMPPASPTLGAQPMYSPQYGDGGRATPNRRNDESMMDVDNMAMTAMNTTQELHTPTAARSGYRHATEEDFAAAKSADEEDQATLDPAKVQTIDAACLQSGSSIVLRSYSRPATVGAGISSSTTKSSKKSDNDKYRLADLTGVGLGRDEEILIIQKVISTAQEERAETVTSYLRHGDTVMLYSKAAAGRALGSRKFVNASGTASRLEIGFFSYSSTGTSKSEIWIILKARADKEVLVGRAAVAATQQRESSSHSRSTPMNQAVGMPAHVRSNDPILLRNCYNGGILSVSEEGQLVLLTDSYRHQQRTDDDPTLLGRLQQHDRLYPTPQDTFQMILSSIPPCPPWVAARSRDERIYLSGSYLLQPRRNQRSADFESALFDGTSSASGILEAARLHPASDENLSPKTKERILLDEVIGSFLGLEGLHVRLKGARGHTSSMDHFEFKLFEADGVTFDVGLRNLVEQILPLSTSFVRVRNFVNARHPGYEYGRVMQAFCEALDALLQDYVHFVAQLEWELRKYTKSSDTLTMKSLYFQITPSLHSMSILEHACEAVCESKGGELINTLWSLDKRSYMGDTVAKKVLGILLDQASEPYMEIMSEWLQTGKLVDPYQEFMVRRGTLEPHGRLDGDLWLELFQIDEDHVVQGVASNYWTKDTILTTGKYWNAVHACQVDPKDLEDLLPSSKSQIPRLPFNSDTSAMAAYIDARYQSASQVLVRILLEKFKLVESLQIMKRYFLIDQGDFLMHFLDEAETELLRPVDDISMGRLQHWLNTSIQMTEAYKEEVDPVSGVRINASTCPLVPAGLRCRLSDETLVSHLDSLYGGGIADQGPVTPRRRAYGMASQGPVGVEVFTIDFPRVPFPISLLLSQKAMGDYQLLFRHLFFTKHVERRLIGVWRDHQLLKKLDVLRGALGPTFLLRQRMLHFVQNLIYYMVFEVVESHWMDMRNAMDRAGASRPPTERPQTVDDLLQVHNTFLNRTLEACLLTNSDLIRSLTKLLNTCLLFTDQMKRFMDTTKIHDDSIVRAAEKRGVVQRNLNERGLSQSQLDKRALRKAFATAREERQAIHDRQTRRVGREVQSESYQRMVQRFEEVFNQDLAFFMRQLNAHTRSGVVANLGIRLDYNGYVTASISRKV